MDTSSFLPTASTRRCCGNSDIVQMEESVLTLDDALRMGARIYKKHRIYEKVLTIGLRRPLSILTAAALVFIASL